MCYIGAWHFICVTARGAERENKVQPELYSSTHKEDVPDIVFIHDPIGFLRHAMAYATLDLVECPSPGRDRQLTVTRQFSHNLLSVLAVERLPNTLQKKKMKKEKTLSFSSLPLCWVCSRSCRYFKSLSVREQDCRHHGRVIPC